MKFARMSADKKIVELVDHFNPFEEPAKSALPADWVFVEVDDRCDFSWVYSEERAAFVPPTPDWFYQQERNAADQWFKEQLEAMTARDDIAFHPWEASILYRDEFIALMQERKAKYDAAALKYKDVDYSAMLDAIAPIKPTVVTLVTDEETSAAP